MHCGIEKEGEMIPQNASVLPCFQSHMHHICDILLFGINFTAVVKKLRKF